MLLLAAMSYVQISKTYRYPSSQLVKHSVNIAGHLHAMKYCEGIKSSEVRLNDL